MSSLAGKKSLHRKAALPLPAEAGSPRAEESMDIYGRIWPDSLNMRCKTCHQPFKLIEKDYHGRCTHEAISMDVVKRAGAAVDRYAAGDDETRHLIHVRAQGHIPVYVKAGRRYICVGVLNSSRLDLETNGHYLVTRRGGSTTTTPVEPRYVEVEAAMREVEDEMLAKLNAANRTQPRTRSQSPREQRAVKAWQKVMGDDTILVYDGCSMLDLVQAGMKVLRDRRGVR